MSTNGFTIPEIIIVVFVSGILVSLIFGPLNDLYLSNAVGLKTTVQATELKRALAMIKNDVILSAGFIGINDVDDAFGPDNNSATTERWRWVDSATPSPMGHVLITKNHATSETPGEDTNSDRTLIYMSSDCSTPVTNNTVYFINNNTLYRRTLTNVSTTCGGVAMAQKMTCAGSVSAAPCVAKDAKLLTDVTGFTVSYHATPSSTTPLLDQYSDPLVPAQAVTVVVTLSVGNGSITSSDSIRVNRNNGDAL